jgi:hypothetical protein
MRRAAGGTAGAAPPNGGRRGYQVPFWMNSIL